MYIPPREYNGVSYSTVLYMLDTYAHVNFIDILVYLILANDHMFKVDFLCPFQDDLSTIAMSMYLRINARKEELPSVVLLHTHQRSNRQKRDEYRWLRKNTHISSLKLGYGPFLQCLQNPILVLLDLVL